MKTSDFDFHLPPERIAEAPARPRDAARLLDVHPGEGADGLFDRRVRDLPDVLRAGDLLVFNDTRVIPTRLEGRRGEVRVEATLHKREGEDRWLAFARPGKRLRVGDRVEFGPGLSAEVEAKHEGGEVALRFSVAGAELSAALHRLGSMPLPPYIPRPEGAREEDARDYQTVFAAVEGAVAAPTAGLHFTPELLDRLEAAGIRRAPLTLHVGAGTFLPVKTEDVAGHRMHSEWGEIGPETARAIAETRRRGGRVVAVGTTSLRLLESAAREDGALEPFSGDTDIFITPGYRFKIVDLLLTNFHLPRSTLMMLVSAFAGTRRIREAYAHAIETGYRFYSYGDATLLRRQA
jgi:S-adenosylmethionine:tRNA ribosyltransferase-isomerase